MTCTAFLGSLVSPVVAAGFRDQVICYGIRKTDDKGFFCTSACVCSGDSLYILHLVCCMHMVGLLHATRVDDPPLSTTAVPSTLSRGQTPPPLLLMLPASDRRWRNSSIVLFLVWLVVGMVAIEFLPKSRAWDHSEKHWRKKNCASRAGTWRNICAKSCTECRY